jgi:phage-related protein
VGLVADIGDIYADVHANTDPFDPELQAGLAKAARDADKMLDDAGGKFGSTIADATSEELGKHGKDFAGAIESGLKKNKVQIDGEWFEIDKHGRLHDSAGRYARNLGQQMSEEVADGFKEAARPGGVLSKIGEGIADAIGSGFNVSGRSPLVALLIPALGAIVLAIVGIIQAVNALGAALVALPALIAGISAQVFVLWAAFDGVGEAISGAFAAKNAKELNEALKSLTPSAREFVRSLLPVRDMFRELKALIQERFFDAFGTSLASALKTLGEVSRPGLAQLATALGTFFAQLASFFGSKTFTTFVTEILPATARWVASFGPVFVDFLKALTKMSTVAIPFLERLGELLNKVFIKITEKITEMVNDGSLAEWLDRMLVTFEKLGGVFASLINFVFSFIGAIDQAGGNKALDSIAEFFNRLAFFFSTPVGIQALEGMINAAIVLTEVLGGLIIVFALLFGAVQGAFVAIDAFLTWVTDTAAPNVGKFFAGIGEWAQKAWWAVKQAFAQIVSSVLGALAQVAQFFVNMKNGAIAVWNELISWAKGIGSRILEAVKDLGRILWDTGKAIIRGLWEGMKDAWHAVEDWLAGIGDWITNLKGPMEYDRKLLVPAGNAIMGGLAKGMRDQLPEVLGLAAGITDTLKSIYSMPSMDVPGLDPMQLSATQINNLNMGGMRFDGTPSETEARTAGRAVAGGMMAQIQQQQIRVAVRSM